jgi:hypothetical protein
MPSPSNCIAKGKKGKTNEKEPRKAKSTLSWTPRELAITIE